MRGIMAAGFAATALAGMAPAAVQVQTASCSVAAGCTSFRQFDSSLGQLLSATYTIDAAVTATFQVWNPTFSRQAATVTGSELFSYAIGSAAGSANVSGQTTVDLGVAGSMVGAIAVSNLSFSGRASDLTAFIGTGYVPLSVTMGTSTFTSTNGVLSPSALLLPHVGGANLTATLSYAYAATGAIPEPATWGLMIVGFGVVGWSLRRRRNERRATAR